MGKYGHFLRLRRAPLLPLFIRGSLAGYIPEATEACALFIDHDGFAGLAVRLLAKPGELALLARQSALGSVADPHSRTLNACDV